MKGSDAERIVHGRRLRLDAGGEREKRERPRSCRADLSVGRAAELGGQSSRQVPGSAVEIERKEERDCGTHTFQFRELAVGVVDERLGHE